MFRKLISKYSKNILTPVLTSLFLLALAKIEAPNKFNYTASFISEALVLLLLYYLTTREHKKTKKEVENREKAYSDMLNEEISNATSLMSAVTSVDVGIKEQASEMLKTLLAQKSDFVEKNLKKQKDEIDTARTKYDSLTKEREGIESEIEKNIEQLIKPQSDS